MAMSEFEKVRKDYGIALTGGIGSGKSTVAKYIAGLGYLVVDADMINRRVLEPGSKALEEIEFKLGADFIDKDGNLDRSALKELIFQDESKRKVLEGITHPKIAELTQEVIDERGLLSKPDFWFYEAALIFENSLQHGFYQTWLTYCLPETQKKRVLERDGMSLDLFQKIYSNQMLPDKKKLLADEVIMTESSIEEVYRAVDQLIEKIKKNK